jgi:hypothetical protein
MLWRYTVRLPQTAAGACRLQGLHQAGTSRGNGTAVLMVLKGIVVSDDGWRSMPRTSAEELRYANHQREISIIGNEFAFY